MHLVSPRMCLSPRARSCSSHYQKDTHTPASLYAPVPLDLPNAEQQGTRHSHGHQQGMLPVPAAVKGVTQGPATRNGECGYQSPNPQQPSHAPRRGHDKPPTRPAGFKAALPSPAPNIRDPPPRITEDFAAEARGRRFPFATARRRDCGGSTLNTAPPGYLQHR